MVLLFVKGFVVAASTDTANEQFPDIRRQTWKSSLYVQATFKAVEAFLYLSLGQAFSQICLVFANNAFQDRVLRGSFGRYHYSTLISKLPGSIPKYSHNLVIVVLLHAEPS